MNPMKYPLAPLITLTRMSHGEIAAAVGITSSGVQRWSTRGITERRADQVAVALGFSPYEVWPEMLDHAIEECVGVCVMCGEPFVARKGQRFCGDACRWRTRDAAA